MSVPANRSAYVRSPWQFEVRDDPVPDPGSGQLLVEIAASAVCGTDLHIADRLANEWQPFGHEVAGLVPQALPAPSHASPGTHAAESIGLLETVPELGRELVSHRFRLEEIGAAMFTARDDRGRVKKMVMTTEA